MGEDEKGNDADDGDPCASTILPLERDSYANYANTFYEIAASPWVERPEAFCSRVRKMLGLRTYAATVINYMIKNK